MRCSWNHVRYCPEYSGKPDHPASWNHNLLQHACGSVRNQRHPADPGDRAFCLRNGYHRRSPSGQIYESFPEKKINPMIGGAGISAFPMSSRVIQKMAMEEDPTNVILMQAAGANVSGQIASVIAGGMVINLAASCNQANTVMAALTIMGKGMAGIFAAILIILLLIWILRKVSR